MKINLSTQRILKFIPIIQFLTVFCWIGYCRKNNVKQGEAFKYAMMMIALILLINLPRIILHFIFHNDMLDNIVYYISIYPMLFGIASIAVSAQKKCNF